nr:hypothetical protein [Tanacetum cinerariifolium]
MNNKGKITGPKEIRPVWDNIARVNHQNKLTGLDYDGHVNMSKVLNNVVDSCKRDGDDNQESNSEDENVFETKEVKKTVKPSLEKIEYVNARNTTVENENKVEKPKKFS